MKTYNDIYLDLRRTLKAGGIEDFNLEAKLILGVASGKGREELMRDMNLYALDSADERVDAMVKRRLMGEPIAYVLGEWEFMGLPFTVDRQTLIPRADTELLCELAIKRARQTTDGCRVLDLCCGTGCIGIAVAKTVQTCRVVLVDNSMAALRVARENVARNAVARNTVCIEADAKKAPPVLLGKFDIIVSNPPYVPRGEISTLEPGVRDFEPRAALDGGEDGLDFYRVIIPGWKGILKEGGTMMFECGEGQAQAIMELMTAEGFTRTAAVRDLGGTERVVIGAI